MKTINTIIAFFMLAITAQARELFSVSQPVAVPLGNRGCYHAVFTPDGNSLLVTSETYDGLGIVNLNGAKPYRALSDKVGAGYKVTMSDDGSRVIMREVHFDDLSMSIHALELSTMKLRTVVSHGEHVNNVCFSGGSLAVPSGHRLLKHRVEGIAVKPSSRADAQRAVVTEEDLKMVVYRDGMRVVVDPILESSGKDVNYCWTSLSPDGKRLLFVAHNNAYTCNLDGSQLVDLGVLHAPVWRDDNWVVGMVDSDDGHSITASEIYIVKGNDGAKKQRLTPLDGKIKMFPAVSPAGDRVVYNTDQGELYVINLVER